jgi:hypothetical protein
MVKKRSLLWLWHAEQNRRSVLKPPPYMDWGRVRRGGGCGASFSGNAVDQRPLDLDGERTTSTTLKTSPACRPRRLDDATVVV